MENTILEQKNQNANVRKCHSYLQGIAIVAEIIKGISTRRPGVYPITLIIKRLSFIINGRSNGRIAAITEGKGFPLHYMY